MVAFAYNIIQCGITNMTRKQIGPTVIQDIALNLVFSVMGERRINRTQQEYAAIAAKLPSLKMLSFKVNQLLQSIHRESVRNKISLPQLCRFKVGDQRWNYEDYPQKISRETMRIALEVSGMRRPRGKRTKSL